MKKDQKTKYLCMYNCTENKRSLYTKPNENGVIIYSIFVHKLVAKKLAFDFPFVYQEKFGLLFQSARLVVVGPTLQRKVLRSLLCSNILQTVLKD